MRRFALLLLCLSGACLAQAPARSVEDPKQLEARVEALRKAADAAPDGEARYRELARIVEAYGRAGQFAKQLGERDRIIEDRLVGPGRRASVASTQAGSLATAGELARSRRMIARARELAAQAPDEEIELLPFDPLVNVLHAEAEIHERQGNSAQAIAVSQQLLDRTFAIEADTRASAKRKLAGRTSFYGQMWNHTRYLDMAGRRDEALALAREVRTQASQPDARVSGARLAHLDYIVARSLATAGDYEAALVAIEAALEKFRRAGVHDHDNAHALAHRLRAIVLVGLGRAAEIGPEIETFLAARSSNPVLAGNTSGHEAAAWRSVAAGAYDEAARHAIGRAEDALRWSGRNSSSYKTARAQVLFVRALQVEKPLAASDIESYLDIVSSDASQRAIVIEGAALERALSRLGDDPASRALGLRIAEFLRMDASQGALLAGAAKLAAASPELRSLIEREQQILNEGLEQRRAAAVALGAAERSAKAESPDEFLLKRQRADAEEKAKLLAANDARLEESRREITRKFPRYQELASPRIPDAAQIAKALRADEIYVNAYPGREAGYVFVVRPDASLAAWTVPITRARTAQLVARYRQVFDRQAVPQRPNDWGGLDTEAGAQLHAAWLAPILARVGNGKTLYVAASGPLAALPWGALPARAGVTPRDSEWAIQQAAFVAMPSASSLVLVRSLQAAPANQPMKAFADPSFDGSPDTAAPPGSPVRRSAIKRSGDDPLGGFDYRRVPRLPETLAEVKAIAELMHAGPDSIVSGRAATRTRVLNDDLSQARVVVFATHGIVPGELPGFHKAGLAMAFEGRGLPDSILTVEDVTALRLNADVVLLSACNTGTATGGAGDSVSALARGFFIAGARSLMVTAWAVESESAMKLTVKTFAALQGDTGASRAQALAKAQRAMLAGESGDLQRHPFFWAPYFVVGDAGR